jgi:hypothetical protein
LRNLSGMSFSRLILRLLHRKFQVNGDCYRQNVQFDYGLLLDGITSQ